MRPLPEQTPDEPMTIPVKSCCGVLIADQCDCLRELAEAVEALASPLPWRWSK